MRLFERLRDEYGYTDGYDTVRRFVRKHRVAKRETFIALDHAHGQRMEADFVKIYVDLPEGRRQVSVLILVWSCLFADGADRIDSGRDAAVLRVFWLRSSRSVVGQSEDRSGRITGRT
jgi:hypothetical protein